jgi:uncharacterized protein (TIGR03435 family)
MLVPIVALVTVVAALVTSQDKGLSSQVGMSFEVISVKPMQSGRQDRFESYCANGGGFISRGTPLLWSIKWAYDIWDYQMSDSWPLWLNAFDTYEIEAKAERSVTEDECKEMVRSLFEERFKLRMHRETKNTSAYALVIGKNGPKLPATTGVTINEAVKQTTSERGGPAGWTMPRLANYLATVRGVQRPVIDRTNLNGTHAFALNYSTREGDDRPDIFSALQQQLGLKLEPTKATIEMWFVDHVDRPKEN